MTPSEKTVFILGGLHRDHFVSAHTACTNLLVRCAVKLLSCNVRVHLCTHTQSRANFLQSAAQLPVIEVEREEREEERSRGQNDLPGEELFQVSLVVY